MNRIKKWVKIFRLKLRVIFILLILLILLDQWVIWAFKEQIKGDGVFRLKAEEKHVVETYLDLICQDQGRRVLFIGDSVMFGSASKSDHETIPAYVAKMAQKRWPKERIHYYNLGFKGLSIGDAYYLLKRLKDKNHPFDLIVYDVNIGWFTDNLINRKLILELYDPDEVDWKTLSLEAPHKGIGDYLDEHIMKYWKFYHYRYLVNHWIFGKPAATKFREEVNHFYYGIETEEKKLLLPWYEKKWDDKFKGDWKLGRVPYDTVQWSYFDQLFALMNEMSKESLAFIIPRNHELLERYDRIDYDEMEKVKAAIRQVAERNQVYLIDYEYLLDSKLFSDTVHPLPAGNQLIAKELINRIEELGILTE